MGLFGRIFKSTREPDLHYAAKGFVHVMISKKFAPHLNLNALERGYAEELHGQGCSREQALSARWGGAYAIHVDVAEFDGALESFKQARKDLGGDEGFATKADAERAYLAAGLLIIGRAHTIDPKEYGRFLFHINA